MELLPGPTTVLPDEISPTLHLDGYRPQVVIAGANIWVGIAFYIDGAPGTAAHTLWTGDDLVFGERVLRVITVICRFLNAASSDAERVVFMRLATALSQLPVRTYTGLKYLSSRNDETDVVFDIPGDDRVLRVVEDGFAEVLDSLQLADWHEQRLAEEGEGDDG